VTRINVVLMEQGAPEGSAIRADVGTTPVAPESTIKESPVTAMRGSFTVPR
jgi:hypothetical protein